MEEQIKRNLVRRLKEHYLSDSEQEKGQILRQVELVLGNTTQVPSPLTRSKSVPSICNCQGFFQGRGKCLFCE